MAECPLVSARGRDLHPSNCKVDEIIAGLSDSNKSDYFALTGGAGGRRSALCIWRSNAYPTPCADDPGQASVFRLCCRFNHACCPNAHIAWNAQMGRQTVYALRDIAKGEEITVAYIGGDALYTRANRQALLQRKFGFLCACLLCELSGEALAASDARQSRIFEITQTLQGFAAMRGVRNWPESTVTLVAERLRLMDEDGLPAVWGKTCCYLAVLWLRAAGRPEDAAAWATRGVNRTRVALGTNSVECQRFVDLAHECHADAARSYSAAR